MNIQQIPLNKLIPCPANVRRFGAATGIEELAANIKALGLLQNLQVRAADNGKFEVVAGMRRLKALKHLAKEKAIAKDALIECNMLGEDEDASEISLAENVIRLPMHPADQFVAFKGLADTGKGPEDIAARFGCSPAIVRQRLKLASVSPALLDLYRAEEMTLDQLMAFTVSDDHEAQEKLWAELPEFNRRPDSIRRLLTQLHVEADDDKALFVGIEAYVAAGGAVMRDLFDEKHQGYLTDPALLDRLATERLQSEAEAVRAEGWKWLEILPDLDYAALRQFHRLRPDMQPLSDEQQAELDGLSARHDALVKEYGEDMPDDASAEMEAICEQLDALSEGTPVWKREDIALAGAVIGIGHAGRLTIERGLVRPEDMPNGHEKPGTAHGGKRTGKGGKQGNGAAGNALPAPLVEDLTAQRTAALRAMLLGNADISLVAVVHALALPLFYGSYHPETCLELRLSNAVLRGTEDSSAAATLNQRHEEFRRTLPDAAGDLWDWLLARDMATHLDLLAFCAACSVNAVVKPHERSDDRVAHADRLAVALNLDMAQWWQPTGAAYLAHVPKARILEAVREGVNASAAENLAKLKKDALVSHAEQRLAETGWLPALLRSPVTAAAEPDAETLAA